MTIKNLYSTVQPSLSLDFANVKALDPRITFARASTARYYDGVSTAKAEENLLIRSQEFDNAAWAKVAASVTANTTSAPDGTTTAETLTATAGASDHRIAQTSLSTAGTQRVFSIFAKAGTLDYVQLAFGGDSTSYANFDITSGAGAVGTVGATATASIVDAGGGWYRCIISTSSATASTLVQVAMITSATAVRLESWTAAGTETVFLWGAQLEQRSAVTAYTPTTTQPITNYVPVLQSAANNVARFDHNPVTGESLGLLIEEQRTNLFTYSEQFDDAAWVKIRASITANTVVAPDGTLTGDKLVANTDNNTHATLNAATGTTNSSPITLSIFAKAGEYSGLRLRIQSSPTGTTVSDCNFDLITGVADTPTNTGTATSSSATITPVGNGWFRCSLRTTLTNSETQTNGYAFVGSNGTTFNFAGNGFSGIYIWGAQLEAGAFPTSYIPTVASQVTRSLDEANMTGANFSSWYRADEGTLYAEAQVETNRNVSGTFRHLAYISPDANDQATISLLYTSGNAFQSEVRNNNANVFSQTVGSNNGQVAKLAVAYRKDDTGFTSNGATPATSSSVSAPVTPQPPTRISIGRTRAGQAAGILNGHLRKLSYYPLRLQNAEIAALTQN